MEAYIHKKQFMKRFKKLLIFFHKFFYFFLNYIHIFFAFFSFLAGFSSASPSEVANAIGQGNATFLQGIKGIGAKTAQRVIVDLKGKLSKELIPCEKVETGYNTKKEEALSGLVILGFSKLMAEKVLNKIIEKEGAALPVEQLIRHALKIL